MKETEQDIQPGGHSARNTAIGFVLGMLIGGLVDLFTGDFGVATILGMVLGAVIGYRGFDRFYLMEYPPAVVRNLVISGVLFFVSFLGAITLITREIGNFSQLVVAVFPIPPLLFFIYSISHAISTLDEFQRRVQVEAIAIGFGITAAIMIAFGLLGMAGANQPGSMVVLVIMVGSWLLGKVWTRWKYR